MIGRAAKRALAGAARRAGFALTRFPPSDLPAADVALWRRAAPYTMTPPERLAALTSAVRHVVRHGVAGAIVECGVWRGGSMLAAAEALVEEGDTTRDLWLYDTFEGMVAPSRWDVRADGLKAVDAFGAKARAGGSGSDWAYASLDDVRRTMALSRYPQERLRFVAGPVEETIPAQMPAQVAILRLDTDWYESTRHELEHLAPLVPPGGVVLIDDYGSWEGARRAVDEWMSADPRPLFLHRVDGCARSVLIPG